VGIVFTLRPSEFSLARHSVATCNDFLLGPARHLCAIGPPM